jgi:two-component system, chemotaxis family, protein-glutamate methylesterase/glutaminase
LSTTAERRPRDIIVIGGSSGAIDALQKIVCAFPAEFQAAVFIVVHLPTDAHSYLPSILTRAGALTALNPGDGDPVRPGHIYVAAPDHHMTLAAGRIHMRRGPRENRHRPAIDPLFRSASRTYGRRVIGVVLSGHLDDGSAGLYAVRSRGGLGIVQESGDAQAAGMPQHAWQYAGGDLVLPAREIGPKLVDLVNTPQEADVMSQGKGDGDVNFNEQHREHASYPDQGNGTPSVFACPECHGVLWELHEGKMLRFECRVGHSYTAATLNEEMHGAAEAALWAAVRALEEKAAMSRRLANSADGPKGFVERLTEQAQADTTHAHAIRRMIFGGESDPPDHDVGGESEAA